MNPFDEFLQFMEWPSGEFAQMELERAIDMEIQEYVNHGEIFDECDEDGP